jgi:hypothetical protein
VLFRSVKLGEACAIEVTTQLRLYVTLRIAAGIPQGAVITVKGIIVKPCGEGCFYAPYIHQLVSPLLRIPAQRQLLGTLPGRVSWPILLLRARPRLRHFEAQATEHGPAVAGFGLIPCLYPVDALPDFAPG